MSWFDAKGLNWAKTALKEAVAHIDKALDIQEEDDSVTEGQSSRYSTSAPLLTRKQKLPGMANREKNNESGPQHSTTENTSALTTLIEPTSTPAAWGSFTGSFFDNPHAQDTPITAPPTSTIMRKGNGASRDHPSGSTSTSDSVERFSPPTSSSSYFPSPPEVITNESESVLAIASSSTTITDKCITPDSLSGSIVIIANKDVVDEEEDSSSYKTVVGDIEAIRGNEERYAESSRVLRARPTALEPTNSTIKLAISADDVQSELQHADSDSTQSFEDVQMQSSLSKDPKSSLASDGDQQKSASAHNSNDEIETTTSSDIEIISNPNGGGDSSSANSTTRASPLKLKKFVNNQAVDSGNITSKKGHFREPSEISILSEDSQSELDKLLHRIGELTEMLETRDLRLVQLERENTEVQQRNSELEAAMEALKGNNANVDSAETYTQRLSALEKKFQTSIRERDGLRTQIHELKNELQMKIPKEDLAESKAMIEELRLEGEKLSKEILQQSNIIKKLRNKEKTSDVLIKKYKDEISSLSEEMERLKKTLNAKEEVERTQIEAVHKMSSEKRKLEEENAQHRSKIEDLQSKLSTMQASFDAVKFELQQRSRQHVDLTRTAEEVTMAKKEMEMVKAENQALVQRVSELREKLRYSEQMTARKEQQLREDNRELLRRLEATELRVETSTQEASMTTIPLMRQLESLQNTLSQRTSHWNEEEKILLDKLSVAQNQLKSLENLETVFKEKLELLQNRCVDLEEKHAHALMHTEKSKMELHQNQLEYDKKERNLNKKISELSETLTEYREKIESLEETNRMLQERLRSVRVEENENYASTDDLMHQSQQAMVDPSVHDQSKMMSSMQRAQSPTISLGRNSLEEALEGSIDWQEDMECISNTERNTTSLTYGLHLNLMGHSATTLEHLQSLLKQRDGELAHIQWEMSRLQEERSLLTEEISSLTTELENVKEKLQSYETLDQSFNDLQCNYDALLQMYGEKVERTEELELDLVELKQAYRTQINELLAQPRKST